MAADTLKRLHKKDPSLGFIIDEGGNLISHPSSLDAWNKWYKEQKRANRQSNAENFCGWFVTSPSSGSISGG